MSHAKLAEKLLAAQLRREALNQFVVVPCNSCKF